MAVTRKLLSAVNTSFAAEHDDLTTFQSDYVVILAALFCALICAIGLAMVARCYCLHRRLSFPLMTPSHASPQPPPPGLNKKALQLMPTTKYVDGIVSSDKETDCAICLTDFADGDLMRILPHCGHVFHVSCIDTWLVSHSSCPSCRQLVLLVARCHHCGGISGGHGFSGTENDEREADMMSRQDNAHSFLP